MKTFDTMTWARLGLALALSGCSLSNEDTGGNEPPPPTPHTLIINDIRDATSQYHPQVGTAVTLEGKVVTAVVPIDKNGRINFYIQEPDGGEYSGIYVYDNAKQAPSLQVGDVVTVKGTYAEYKSSSAPETDLPVTEINLTSVEVTGTGTPPVYKFPAASVVDISTTGSRAKAFASVLVELDAAVQVTELLDYGEFKVGTSAENSVRVDDTVYPDAELGKAVGQTITLLRGVLVYSFSDFKLEPRGPDDLVAEPVQFADTDVYHLRDRTLTDAFPAGEPVRLSGMVVTGASGTGTGSFFMQLPEDQYRTAGDPSYSAIFANRGADAGNKAVHVGDVVTVEGTYVQSPPNVAPEASLAQVNVATVTVTGAGTGIVPAPFVAAPATLATGGSNAEKLESALVRVESIAVTVANPDPDLATDPKEFVVTGGLRVDDYLYADVTALGRPLAGQGPFSFIQGPLNFYSGNSKIEPRGASDINTLPVATVYQIQKQLVASATTFAVRNVVVTAVVGTDGANGFFVQVPDAAQDPVLGSRYSAMFCTRKAGVTTAVVAGELVNLEGQYTRNGLTVFEASAIDASPSRLAPLPTPTLVDPAKVALGDLPEYESVRIEVDAVSLEDPAPEGDLSTEFVITGGLRVGKMIFSSAYRYGRIANTGFEYILGIQVYDAGTFKLEPTGTSDMKRNPITATPRTVYQVQDRTDANKAPIDEQVKIEGVIVTAVAGDGHGSFFAQMSDAVTALDARGARYSGIFLDRGTGSLTAAQVHVGDVVTVEGQYAEETDLDAKTLTALLVDATGVTVTGTATVPVPVAIASAADLSVEATAEPYEDVLVKLASVAVLNQYPDGQDHDGGEVLVGTFGGTAGVRVDDMLSADIVTIERRAVAGLASITGVLTQIASTYKLEPRGTSDLVVNAIPGKTIYDLQNPAAGTPLGTGAKLSNVIVTGFTTGTGPFWVQVLDAARDSVLGAKYSGIYCDRLPVSLIEPTPVTVDKNFILDLEGYLALVNGQSTFEVTKVTYIGKADNTNPVYPSEAVIADPATIATGGADSQAYEGVLVQVNDVALTAANPDDPADNGDFAVTGNLRVGSDVYAAGVTTGRLGKPFSYVRGPLAYFDGNFKIEARSSYDIVIVVTPYDLRKPPVVVPQGTRVRLDDMLVTGVVGGGTFIGSIFMQMASPTAGPEYSGIYAFKASAGAAVAGDIVSIEGSYKEFPDGAVPPNSQTELTSTYVTVASHGNPAPTPVSVQVANIATGGVDSDKYESMLVRVDNVSLKTLNPDDPSDYKEFTVVSTASPEAGEVRVDDLLWGPTDPVATLRTQTTFTFIQGVLTFDHAATKIEPRGADDVKYP